MGLVGGVLSKRRVGGVGDVLSGDRTIACVGVGTFIYTRGIARSQRAPLPAALPEYSCKNKLDVCM